MSVRASRRVAALGGYAFAEVDRLVTELRDSGVSVIDFGVGDPKAPTPVLARERAKTALDEHATSGYPSYIGSLSFRRACADWIGRRFGVDVDPEQHISSTIGSKEAVFHAPLAFVDPGDIVVSPDPGYPPYTRGTSFAGGENYRYPLHASAGFLPDLGAIPDDIWTRTRILWICYPNSPTGAVAPLEFFQEAAALCRKHDILLASDEAYSEIYFGDEPPVSALQTGLDNVLAFFSMSKRSNMTGWRAGYVAGDAEAVRLFRKLKTNINSGTPSFIQDAAVTALLDEEHPAAMRAEYRAKRDVLSEAFVAVGLPECRPPATLYLWQRVPDGMGAEDFAKRLLDPAVAVVTTPGTWLSAAGGGPDDPGESYVRLALVPTMDECQEAARRIRAMGTA